MPRTRKQPSGKSQALEELAARRAGRRGRSSPGRRPQSTLIDSSASEVSVRSHSSGDEDGDSDEGALQRVATRLRSRRESGGSKLKGRRAHGEAKKFLKFNEGRTNQVNEKYEYSSDLEDFLVPDDDCGDEDEEHGDGGDGGDDGDGSSDVRASGDDGRINGRSKEGGSEKAPTRGLDDDEEEEGEEDERVAEKERLPSPKKARRVVDSESSESSEGRKNKKEVQPGGKRPQVTAESSEEEWDLTKASSQRTLRERKSIRDQHGGLNPLERIRRAQQRALGIEVANEVVGVDKEVEDSMDEVAERKERRDKVGKEKKRKGKISQEEKRGKGDSKKLPTPGPTTSSATTSTVTRSASDGSTSTATRSGSSSSTSGSSSSTSSQSTASSSSNTSTTSTTPSTSNGDSFLSDGSAGSAERRHVQDLMLAEVGSSRHMSLEEAFKTYMELLFCSSIDPAYEKRVQGSESHRIHYEKAKTKIEYLIITAQQHAHSQAWVNCDPYLLEAIEQFSRFEIRRPEKKPTGGLSNEDMTTCAACHKLGSHGVESMCVLRFIGRRHENAIVCPGESKLGEGMRLSHQYLLASPVYQMNRGLRAKGDNPQYGEELVGKKDGKGKKGRNKGPNAFYLGYVCCRRVTTFHALLHFRRHCLIYLTSRAKAMARSHANLTLDELVDLVLNEDAHRLMFGCFRDMLKVAQSMQLSSGAEAHHAVSRHGAFRSLAPQEVLLGDEGTDVSSLDWDEHGDDADTDDDDADEEDEVDEAST